MNLKPIASKMTEVTINGGKILFSYSTPVAAYLVAAYVLHDAVLKDRKYIATLLNQKFAIRDETIEDCAQLVDSYNDQTETGDTLTMLAENMRKLKTEIL